MCLGELLDGPLGLSGLCLSLPDNVLKDKLTINLREAYADYFRLRDSNVDGRTDVFSSLYT